MLLSTVVAGLGGRVVRDGEVTGFGPLAMVAPGLLHYYADPRFRPELLALTGARAVLTTPELAPDIPAGFALALGDAPKEMFLKAYLQHGAALEAPAPVANAIDPAARIHPRAVIAGHSVRIGAGAVIGPNAVIHERVTIEDEAVIGANSVLGGDGFEVGMVDGHQVVVPHYGTVLVRRGAVIMSNVAVDWGLYRGCTEVGEYSVVDNLVHVAHNVKIGRNCQIIACAMLAGSTVIADGARVGPNATVSNGLRLGADSRITLGAVVTRDVEAGGHVTGNFAVPHSDFLRQLRAARG